MAGYKVGGGKGFIELSKSTKLVGLRTVANRSVPEEVGVKNQLLENLGGFKVVALQKKANQSMDERLDEARANDDIELGTHIYTAKGSSKPMVPNGNIYIVFDDDCEPVEQASLLDAFALTLKSRRGANRVIAKVSASSPNPVKCAALLNENPKIKYAEPDMDVIPDHYFAPPVDDLMMHEWHLRNPGGFVPDNSNYRLRKGADSRVVDAWARLGNLGSSNIVVAVIDNGFDLTHPDINAKLFKPHDLWNGTPQLLQGDPSFTHGTPCASVAIAPANGSGMVGSAPNARFMPISGTSYSLESTEAMYEYCINNGADVISCSWGTVDPNFSPNSLKKQAIARAAKEGRGGKGCVICYAAGNEGMDYINYYGTIPEVISVGACTSNDEHASYSNQGPELTIVAPSNGDWPIIAARAWWDEGTPGESGHFKYWMDGQNRGDRYQHFGGTSSATPLVAGICALMLSANPNLTAREVKEIVISTADKIGAAADYDASGHSVRFGHGRINADKCVAEAFRRRGINSGSTTTPAPTPTPVQPAPPVTAKGQGLFMFDVKRHPSAGYGVQIGNFASYGNVLTQVERLKTLFNQPVLVHINTYQGQTVYRVIVGSFATTTDANRLLTNMKAKGVNGFVQDLGKLV